MRRFALPIALVVGLLASGASSAASRTAFTGEWIGNDPLPPDGDGSTVHLYISGGTHSNITFTDEFGSVCGNNGSSVDFFTSTLTGEVDGDVMVGTIRAARCGSVPLRFLYGETDILVLDDQGNADPSDDTLYDSYDVTWHRV